MITLGYVLLFVGGLAALTGEVLLLKVAYQRGLVWFFGCLIFPPLWFALLAFHFQKTWRPVVLSYAGIAVFLLGAYWAGMAVN